MRLIPLAPYPPRCRTMLRGCCCNFLARSSPPFRLRRKKWLLSRNPAPRLRAASLRLRTRCAPFGRSTAFESTLHPEGTCRAGRHSRVHCRAITTRRAQRSGAHTGDHHASAATSFVRPTHQRERLAPDRDAALPLFGLLRSDRRGSGGYRRSPWGTGAGAAARLMWREKGSGWRPLIRRAARATFSRKGRREEGTVRHSWMVR
jgi:hypothetical protein